jgi:hypothetical protein
MLIDVLRCVGHHIDAINKGGGDMARQAESVDPGWPGGSPEVRTTFDDPALIRAQLARMNEGQLRRLLVWLDQRGASTGKTFAVHQADPRDPASRDLIELQVSGFGIERSRPRLRLPAAARPGRAARAGGVRFGLAT